jgi:hypothetical protein
VKKERKKAEGKRQKEKGKDENFHKKLFIGLC